MPREVPARAYVSSFNFRGTDQQKLVGALSGGERNRVHLAKLLQSGGNVLLLDEPTNDLDVDTLRALEAGLESFPGCVVVISHDRWFLDRIATHILAFEGDSQVRWFEGNVTDYEAFRHKELGAAADQPHRIKYKRLGERPACRHRLGAAPRARAPDVPDAPVAYCIDVAPWSGQCAEPLSVRSRSSSSHSSLIQLVPYGRDHTNPPVTGEPPWDSAATRASRGRRLLRLPQQRDRMALVLERRPALVAPAEARRRGARRAELLGVGDRRAGDRRHRRRRARTARCRPGTT